MIKKLTRNLLSTILIVLLAVGVFGIAAPKEVHAAGTWNIKYTASTPNMDIFTNVGSGDTITIEQFNTAFGYAQNYYAEFTSGSDANVISYEKTKLTVKGLGPVRIHAKRKNGTGKYFDLQVYQTHTHSWTDASYSASGNVITATCQGTVGTCDLTKPTLTLNASGKTYDGSVVTATTTPNGTWSSQGLPTPTISYSPANSKNVGTYTASAKVGNATATQSFTISPKEIGLTWGTSTFTYDGQSHAPTATATGLASGDSCTVTVDGAQTNAGNHTATAASLSNSNYKLPTSNTKQFTIKQKAIDLTGLVAKYKDYDGNNTASFDKSSATLTNVLPEDENKVSLGEVKGTFEDKMAGKDKPVTVTNVTLEGEAAGNYTLNPITGLQATIHKLTTEVNGIKANDKVYDGTKDATVDTSEMRFANKIDNDDLSISVTGEFEDANVGEKKTVNLTLGKLAGADAGNYIFDENDSQKTTTASITPKAMTVNASGYEDEWDGNPHSISVSVDDPADGYTITYKGPKDSDFSSNNPAFTDPGTYEVTYKVTADNYAETTGTATVNIIGQDFKDITSEKYEGVYDGNNHGITVKVPDKYESYTITYSESEDGEYTTAPITYKYFTNGEKTVYYKVSNTGFNDYKGSDTVNITQKEIGLSWGTNTFTYDGKVHAPTATATNLVVGDECKVTVTGEQTDSNVKTKTENYTATATELSNNNYKLPSEVTKDFTITQKEVTLDWGETALTYNGTKQHPEVTVDVEDLVAGESCDAIVEGAQKDSNVKSGESSYTAEVTALSDANYKLSQTAETTKDFTIAQAKITVSGIKSLNKKYDGNDDATKSLYFTEAKLDGKVAGEVLGVKATGTFPKSVVGDYTITLDNLELTGDDIIKDNYVLAETGQQTTCEGSITKFEVTVTADNKEKFYGEDDPTFTFKSDPKVLVDDDVLEGELSRDKDENSENVGNYVINAGTLHDHNHNYAIKFIEGTLTINQATSNTVTASIEGWTYGDKANEPSAKATHGEKTATFSYSKTADGEYSSTVPTNAGTYYVKATIPETDNYVGAVSEPVEFEIAPKEIGLLWGETAFVYDGLEHVPTASATDLVGIDECEVTVTGKQTDSNAKTKTENYTATASITNPNYKLPENHTTSFTIAQKEITVSGIKVNDKTYDRKTDAELDYTNVVLNGKIGDEDVSVEATGTFEDKNAKEDKTVTISNLTLTGKDAGNYILASEGQQKDTTATINKKPITVTAEEKTKYYGNDDPELTYTVDPELIEGDSFEGSLTRVPGENVDDYLIHQGTLSAGNNYYITYIPSELEIFPAVITITAEDKTSAYGDNLQKLTYSVDVSEGRIPESDELKIKYDTEASNTAVVGEYDITPSWEEENTNYNVKFVKGTYTITQRVVKLEWSDTELTYNGKAQKPKATVTNLVGEDECVVTVEGEKKDSNIKTDTDKYTATAKELSNPNYKLPEEDEKKTTEFTIAPKQLTDDMLSVDPESIKNDGTKKGPKITLNDEEVGDLTDEDYELSGETESDKSGTHFFEVEAKGNYTGSLSSSWVMYENRQNHDKQKGTDGKGDIEIFVDVIGNTENITVDNFTIDFAKKLLSKEDLERYNNGENVLIYVELEEESKDDVAANYKEPILSEFNKVAAKDIRWFDITVWKRIGNDKATQIHDTIDNLEMTISVPDEYKNAPADNTRTFYLARSHNGEAEIITKTNEKKVGLSSNKFSIYALAYKDTYHGSKYIVPKTGD